MLNRDLRQDLLNWKNNQRRKPLILQGARQVGKTYLIKDFGRNNFQNLVYLNFDEDSSLKSFFETSLAPEVILDKLETYLSIKIELSSSLIFFDEIQECPHALNSLKYFQEWESDSFIIAAGSLLGVKLSSGVGFPVGKVQFLELMPLSFLEFLTALDKHGLRDMLEDNSDFNKIDRAFHEQLLLLLKKYLYIGGMPEVVAEYIRTKDFNVVIQTQKDILSAYELDFSKHVPKSDFPKVMQVWESLPMQLAKENKKFIFSAMRKSARAREYENAIEWLQSAGLIRKVYRVSGIKLPLASYKQDNIFKIYLLDSGLLCRMCNLPQSIVVTEDKIFSEFFGAVTENYVLNQMIKEKNDKIYYWESDGVAEVDFIIEKDLEVYPIEVKYGTSRNKKSLQSYNKKYNPKCCFRVSRMNLQHDDWLINLPLYICGLIKNYIA